MSNDYTMAPSTTLLATHCACCGRALRDAESVERGIGPDCAEKYGVADASTTPDFEAAERALIDGPAVRPCWTDGVRDAMSRRDAHGAANALVHWIAAQPRVEGTEAALTALRALGYAAMAGRVAKRFEAYLAEREAERTAAKEAAARLAAKRPVIRVEYQGATMRLSCENLAAEQFAAYIAAMRQVPGRKWMPESKTNGIPVSSKRALLDVLRAQADLHGVTIRSDKGEFTISDAQ